MKNIYIVVACLIICTNTVKTQTIDSTDAQKYKDALLYIVNDTTIKGKIYVSSIIVDMDRFWLKDIVSTNCKYRKILDSLIKWTWFEEFSSPLIEEIFENHNRNLWYHEKGNVLFFSTIEKNTLRADVFIDMDRGQLSKLTFKSTMFWGYPVHGYLFFFDCSDKIEDVFSFNLIYD